MATQPGVGYTFTTSSQGENFNIMQPLESYTSMVYEGDLHPFKVTNLGKKPSVDEWYFKVQPGLVNNLNPMIEGTSWYMDHMPTDDWLFVYYKWQFNVTTGYSYIVLQLGYDSATPGVFPDSNTAHVSASPSYPVVASLSYMPTTGDTDSYIVLATAYQDPTTKEITVWQQVQSSIWADRLKVSTLAAKYYFARI